MNQKEMYHQRHSGALLPPQRAGLIEQTLFVVMQVQVEPSNHLDIMLVDSYEGGEKIRNQNKTLYHRLWGVNPSRRAGLSSMTLLFIFRVAEGDSK